MPAMCADAGGKYRDLLQFVRYGANDVEARDRCQLADLLNRNLDFAVGAGLGRIAVIGFELGPEFLSEAEPRELAGEV